MTGVSVALHRELTFEEAIRAPGRKIEPPYRPFTELQRDPRLMAFNFRAPLDEVGEHELRAMLHRRRMGDIREIAARNGIPAGQVLAAEPRMPRDTSGMFDPDHESRVELAEQATGAEIQILAERVPENQRRAASEMHGVVNRSRHGPVEGVFQNIGERVGGASGSAIAGGAIGGTVGKTVGSGMGRAVGMAADAAGYGATGVAKNAAWVPFSYLGFEMDDGPPKTKPSKLRKRPEL